jgi:hypothetical protein
MEYPARIPAATESTSSNVAQETISTVLKGAGFW